MKFNVQMCKYADVQKRLKSSNNSPSGDGGKKNRTDKSSAMICGTRVRRQ